MTSPKPNNTKAKSKKTAVIKDDQGVEEVTEVVVPEPPKAEITGYVVPIFFQREPVEKDIPVADMFYHKVSNSFTLQCHRPNMEAQVEQVIAGDIAVSEGGNVTMISKAESPITWITSLYKSTAFSGNPFIAQEAQELYEA